MTDLVEPVARALCIKRGHNPDERTAKGPYWTWFREDAEVALKAIKTALIEATARRRTITLADF